MNYLCTWYSWYIAEANPVTCLPAHLLCNVVVWVSSRTDSDNAPLGGQTVGRVYEHVFPALDTTASTHILQKTPVPASKPFLILPDLRWGIIRHLLDRRPRWVSRRRRILLARDRCCCRPLHLRGSRWLSRSRASWPDSRRSSTRRRSCGCFCRGEIHEDGGFAASDACRCLVVLVWGLFV